MSFSFPSSQAVEAWRHKGEEGTKERKALVVQRQFLCSLSPYIFTEPTSEPALHLATGKRKKTSTQFFVAMVWIERIEQVFPSLRLKSNVRQTIQYASSLKADCQAMPVIRQAQHFLENHPFMCLFLVILVVLGFLPFLVFLAFVLGSFLSISFCALLVFGGTVTVASFSLLVILSPVMLSGGVLAVFLYLTFCFVTRVQKIIERTARNCTLFNKSRRSSNRRMRQETAQFRVF